MSKICKSIVPGKRVAVALVVAAGMVSTSAHAAVDLTGITGAFTAADVTVGVLAIGAVLATIYATKKAAMMALSMLRGG